MPVRAYVQFAAANLRFIGFGFVVAMASSFGQTYFIGVFGPSLQNEFGLSHTGWGVVYLLGTLASAAVLPWSGRQIDVRDLRVYTLCVAGLLAIACGFTAVVASVAMLTGAIFLLRHAGQGLMSHIAITSMARYYDKDRGRAIAIAALGFAAGEALLPFVAVALIAAIGWRWSYAVAAIAVVAAVVPITQWLLRGHGRRHADHVRALGDSPFKVKTVRSWTRAEVLRDVRFYLLLPGVLAPALVITALFFHHLGLADAKGWSHAWITGSYVVFAAASTVTSLACGSLIDRIGGTRLVPVMLLPLVLGLVAVAHFDHRLTVAVYLALIGVSVGIAHTAVAAMWAEVYGVAHIGAIRSMVSALGVFASALGPIIVGALLDVGFSIEIACIVLAAYAGVGALLLVVALRRDTGRHAAV